MNYKSLKHNENVSNFDRIAKLIMRSEMRKRGISYEELSKLLKKNLSDYTISSLTLKITRGKFSFSFFLECMYVMEAKTLDFSHFFYNSDK